MNCNRSILPARAAIPEIVIECDTDKADNVSRWLTAAMTDAMAPFADPVPVAVDVSVSTTWGGD